MLIQISGQTWDPGSYEHNARFVSDLGRELVELLAPQPGERVLDLGCGDGALTQRLVEAGCQVVAVDSSAEQVAGARARGLDAHVHAAEALPFEDEFDAVFSNAVLHWIPDAQGVLRGVRRALRPKGRFVAEMGGAGNVAAIRDALKSAVQRRGVDAEALDPWFFPGENEYRDHLERAGFDVESITLFARPTPLPGHLANWLQTFAQPFLEPFGREDRQELIDEVCDSLRDVLHNDGQWTADYARLRFHATRR